MSYPNEVKQPSQDEPTAQALNAKDETEEYLGSKLVHIAKGKGVDYQNVGRAIEYLRRKDYQKLYEVFGSTYHILDAANLAFRKSSNLEESSVQFTVFYDKEDKNHFLKTLKGVFRLLPEPVILFLQAHHNDSFDPPDTCHKTPLQSGHRKEIYSLLKNLRRIAKKKHSTSKLEYEVIKHFYINLNELLQGFFVDNLPLIKAGDFSFDNISLLSPKEREYRLLVLQLFELKEKITARYPTLYWECQESFAKGSIKNLESVATIELVKNIRGARKELWSYIINFIDLNFGQDVAKQIKEQLEVNPDFQVSWDSIDQKIIELRNKFTEENYDKALIPFVENSIEQFKVAKQALIDIQKKIVDIPTQEKFNTIKEVCIHAGRISPSKKKVSSLPELSQILYTAQTSLTALNAVDFTGTTADRAISRLTSENRKSLYKIHTVSTELDRTFVRSDSVSNNNLEPLCKSIKVTANEKLFYAANLSTLFGMPENIKRARELYAKITSLDVLQSSPQTLATLIAEFKTIEKKIDVDDRRFFLIKLFDFQKRALRNGIAKTLKDIHNFANEHEEYPELKKACEQEVKADELYVGENGGEFGRMSVVPT